MMFRSLLKGPSLRCSLSFSRLAKTCSFCSFPSSTAKNDDFYEYTSGKWLWNNELRHQERKRYFNAPALKSLAAAAINRPVENVIHFAKLAEGGSNRTFLLSMRDGFQMVAPIPYSATQPKSLLVASEAATMDYLRALDFPVPTVYGYSTTADNPAGTEYMFLEFMPGRNLGDIWFNLGEKARIKVVEKLVDLESRLFSLDFPAGGSLFYTSDLDSNWSGVPVPLQGESRNSTFGIGPDLTLGLWYGKREGIKAFRGPYRDSHEALAAGAEKEIKHLNEHGRPLHPWQRLRREYFSFQRQSHTDYVSVLRDYLLILPDITPKDSPKTLQPKLRHPDLQPNNIFVSNDLEIAGLIDWQHCTILPLFLQAGIPGSIQNHGDEVSELLKFPALPENFDNLDEHAQFNEVQLLRKRQLHFHYVEKTLSSGSVHGEVLTDALSILRRKLFWHASAPWEGDNVTLRADLIDFIRAWPLFAQSESRQSVPKCPIEFSEAEQQECIQCAAAMHDADAQFSTCLDLVGVGPEGWVPVEQYDDARSRAQQLLKDTLENAESDEEREKIQTHWIFNDFDEEEYL